MKVAAGSGPSTSSFSADAENYVKKLDSKIILIYGRQSAELMIEYNAGVVEVAAEMRNGWTLNRFRSGDD
ncbi:hypothetical protein [uncultured Desulfosarcina sp.]|uniref:hypothetical protein n=1 Tax=uncultured Desulfosarcina sp. TaxID=218289 RepID=UPI0029C987C8|nr:hypothetical protein [uncultured Desulfosarcina sp.]